MPRALGRRAPARRAGAHPARARQPAAARRADAPSRPRRQGGARGRARPVPGRGRGGDARPLAHGAARDPRDRGQRRPGDRTTRAATTTTRRRGSPAPVRPRPPARWPPRRRARRGSPKPSRGQAPREAAPRPQAAANARGGRADAAEAPARDPARREGDRAARGRGPRARGPARRPRGLPRRGAGAGAGHALRAPAGGDRLAVATPGRARAAHSAHGRHDWRAGLRAGRDGRRRRLRLHRRRGRARRAGGAPEPGGRGRHGGVQRGLERPARRSLPARGRHLGVRGATVLPLGRLRRGLGVPGRQERQRRGGGDGARGLRPPRDRPALDAHGHRPGRDRDLLACLPLDHVAWVGWLLLAVAAGSLVAFVLDAAPRFDAANFVPFAPHGARGLLAAALLFVGFAGYARVATLGEEIRDPARTIPAAILGAIAVATVLRRHDRGGDRRRRGRHLAELARGGAPLADVARRETPVRARRRRGRRARLRAAEPDARDLAHGVRDGARRRPAGDPVPARRRVAAAPRDDRGRDRGRGAPGGRRRRPAGGDQRLRGPDLLRAGPRQRAATSRTRPRHRGRGLDGTRALPRARDGGAARAAGLGAGGAPGRTGGARGRVPGAPPGLALARRPPLAQQLGVAHRLGRVGLVERALRRLDRALGVAAQHAGGRGLGLGPRVALQTVLEPGRGDDRHRHGEEDAGDARELGADQDGDDHHQRIEAGGGAITRGTMR